MEKKVKYTHVQYKYVKHNTKQYEFSQIILIYGADGGGRGKETMDGSLNTMPTHTMFRSFLCSKNELTIS